MHGQADKEAQWTELHKHLGLTPSIESNDTDSVLTKVKEALELITRQRSAWDVNKSLGQQTNLEAVLTTAKSGISTAFHIPERSIRVFLVTPLDSDPVDVSTVNGLELYRKSMESYERMLDDPDAAAQLEELTVTVPEDAGPDGANSATTPHNITGTTHSQPPKLALTKSVSGQSEVSGTVISLSASAPPQPLSPTSTLTDGSKSLMPSTGRHTLIYHEGAKDVKTIVVDGLDRRTSEISSAEAPRTITRTPSQNAAEASLTQEVVGFQPVFSKQSVTSVTPAVLWKETDSGGYIMADKLPTADINADFTRAVARRVMHACLPLHVVDPTAVRSPPPKTPMPVQKAVSQPALPGVGRRASSGPLMPVEKPPSAPSTLKSASKSAPVAVASTTTLTPLKNRSSPLMPISKTKPPLGASTRSLIKPATAGGSTKSLEAPKATSSPSASSVGSLPAVGPALKNDESVFSVAQEVVDEAQLELVASPAPKAKQAAASPLASTAHSGEKIVKVVGVPMTVLQGGSAGAIGALVFSLEESHAQQLTPNDFPVLDMIATAIAQSKRRVHQMDLAIAAQRRAFGLVEMVKAVSHELSTSDIISRIIGVAYDLLGAERVSVFRVDRERQELMLALSQDAAGFRLPLGKGIVGHVAASGTPMNIPDAYANPLFDKSFDVKTGFVTRSILAMPVKQPDGEVIAVIQAINKKQGGSFTAEDVRTLSVVSDTAGVTLHKATLLQEAETAKTASAALADVVRISNDSSTHDMETLTKKLMEIAYRLVPAERITLFLVDEVKQELYCVQSQDLREIRIPIGHGIAGTVALDMSVVNIPDAYADARFNKAMDEKTGFRTRSILCLPVLSQRRGKPIAVLQAINKVGGVFNKADTDLLDAFATEIGGMIDKVSLQLAYSRALEEDSGSTGGVMSSLLTQFVRVDDVDVAPKKAAAARATSSPDSQSPKKADAVPPAMPTPRPRKALNNTDNTTTLFPNEGVDVTTTNVAASSSVTLAPYVGFRNVSKLVQRWEFDVLQYEPDELVPFFVDMLHFAGVVEPFHIENETLVEFAHAVKNRYRNNPYHNFLHGMSVAHLSFLVLRGSEFPTTVLKPVERLATVMAALCHDVDHPGVTNAFESYSLSPWAVLYNDFSVLEMHHAAEMFTILRAHETSKVDSEEWVSVLQLSRADFTQFRKTAIAGILATDMTHHSTLIEVARKYSPENRAEMSGKNLVELIVHSADLCNPVLPAFRAVHKWADLVCQEFTSQVAQERARGMPVTAHMDGLTSPTAIAKLQCGFIDYVVAPLWDAMVHVIPEIDCAGKNMKRNRGLWKQLQDGAITYEQAIADDVVLSEDS